MALRAIPWYVWCAAAAVSSSLIGAHWDISWHSSIGRDTFWTPAHMAIYLCGLLAGVAFGYLILYTTFAATAPLGPASVHIWGFRAPLGAFIASWGGIAMLTSAPFDNWWHDAYGLDVQIISPPHIVLFIGTYAVIVGTLVLIAGHMNRSEDGSRRKAGWLFLYVSGVLLSTVMIMLEEYTSRPHLHSAISYRMVGTLVPIVLVMASRATGFRFAATFVAGFYTLLVVGLIQILPLFPAEPKLGPVYQHVTHFVPPEFPVLIIVPALALDLLFARAKDWNLWLLAIVSAAVFLTVLVAVEWPFADFLMSPASRNGFFGTIYHFYGQRPTSYEARNLFYDPGITAGFCAEMALALAITTVMIRFGLSRGIWLHRIKR
jgi:hypothetical protein